MARTERDGAQPAVGHGPVRFGPRMPDDGLPVLPELTAVLTAAAQRAEDEPPGGGSTLLEAAAGYWTRRGLPAGPDRIAAAPGAPALLLALTATLGGDVLVPRPCAAWWAPYARLLGRPVFHVPTPPESGGVPDAYALLETVRRVRAEGGDPRQLVLSPADEPTGVVATPDFLHETVEAAESEGLFVISDETWRDTVHDPHRTVLLSPAEMLPGRVAVVSDLRGGLLPAGWPAAIARFPTGPGDGGALRARVLDVLTALGAQIPRPLAVAAAYALSEPDEVVARRTASVRLHARLAAAVHELVVSVGGLTLPPQAGRCVYADLSPLADSLATHGVSDAQELEERLDAHYGVPASGGHRFGDDLAAPRVRLSTGDLLGGDATERAACLTAPDPLELHRVRGSLTRWRTAFDGLGTPAERGESVR
ncbi:aminotransferase class I/II-fold pyridoxal phosphate-dependent enzyme [Streptomyces sp. NPDC002734]|uniref:aminotransferase class I/II-fold pyridoxal phosphate-dependent enzyme n=1 Tax=Streptomyces sp. NPDC002734 TaxID=3154426 RepID=UPI0033186CFE